MEQDAADCFAAEFRGPGMHHRFDDSPDDYDMDMDQRTRMLGPSGGRIIVLGDGTESHDDDGDVDMEDRIHDVEEDSPEEKDEEQLRRDQQPNGANDRSQREETPAPAANDTTQKSDESKLHDDPKTTPAADAPGAESFADKVKAEAK